MRSHLTCFAAGCQCVQFSGTPAQFFRTATGKCGHTSGRKSSAAAAGERTGPCCALQGQSQRVHAFSQMAAASDGADRASGMPASVLCRSGTEAAQAARCGAAAGFFTGGGCAGAFLDAAPRHGPAGRTGMPVLPNAYTDRKQARLKGRACLKACQKHFFDTLSNANRCAGSAFEKACAMLRA